MGETRIGILLIQLLSQNRSKSLDKELEIEQILVRSGLKSDDAVPEWAFSLLDAIVNKNTFEHVPFEFGKKDNGNAVSMLMELTKLLDGECSFDGESLVMSLPSLHIKAVVFFEGFTFSVKPL